jgi:hypothetical protein
MVVQKNYTTINSIQFLNKPFIKQYFVLEFLEIDKNDYD